MFRGFDHGRLERVSTSPLDQHSVNDDTLRDALERYLQQHHDPRAEVRALRPLAGGASCRVYAFDLVVDAKSRPLVLRMDAEGGGAQGDRQEEAAFLAAARAAGAIVPEVHASGGEDDGLGGAFFVMDRVAGEALARRLLRDDRYGAARLALPEQVGRELARTHAVDLARPELEFCVQRSANGDDPRRFALAEVERYREMLEALSADQPYPLLRWTTRWLQRHAPPTSRAALVHGDFRVGNLMFDEKGLTAVLDWELAHVGDPVEDLGWFCVRTWRFGNDRLAAGGLCSREDLLRFYQAAGGSPCDPSSLAWWELFGNWKWAIICRMQAERHRAGAWPDVELAAIGRRVAETEEEILALIDAATGEQ